MLVGYGVASCVACAWMHVRACERMFVLLAKCAGVCLFVLEVAQISVLQYPSFDQCDVIPVMRSKLSDV